MFTDDYIEQPTVVRNKPATTYINEIATSDPPATPSDHTIDYADYDITYGFKAMTNPLNMLPPPISREPYSDFVATDINLSVASFGSTSLIDIPGLGVLTTADSSQNFGPG